MLYLWLIALILLNAVWLALVAFALPGNWLIVTTTALFAWWQADNKIFSVYTLMVIAVLALAGELIELLGGAGGAKRAGARLLGSLGAIFGALTGAVLGTFLIPIPLLGTIFGSCAGAAVGACVFELLAGRKPQDFFRLGFGAGFGQFLGITTKIIIGSLIWLTVAIAAFWP
ncbi:MAG: DUF456 family protein [Planctomycetota bacterium]|nr:MAG: DUF456 family protein [Planctomycetota bacterium]